jgi:hypothetical protein
VLLCQQQQRCCCWAASDQGCHGHCCCRHRRSRRYLACCCMTQQQQQQVVGVRLAAPGVGVRGMILCCCSEGVVVLLPCRVVVAHRWRRAPLGTLHEWTEKCWHVVVDSNR